MSEEKRPRKEGLDHEGFDAAEVDMSWLIEILEEVARERDFKPEDDAALDDASAPLGIAIPSNSFPAYGKPGYYGRPVERIDSFLEELGRFWKKHPDWRFGQLMCNLDRRYRTEHNGNDYFYLEEDQFLEFLEDCER